jgi:hypothetical protein
VPEQRDASSGRTALTRLTSWANPGMREAPRVRPRYGYE